MAEKRRVEKNEHKKTRKIQREQGKHPERDIEEVRKGLAGLGFQDEEIGIG